MPELEPKSELTPSEAGSLAGRLVLQLNETGVKKASRVIDVRGLKRVTLDFQLASGTWSTAVVTLKRGLGHANWVPLEPALAVGPGATVLREVDVEGFSELALDVTTAEGASGEAHVYVYGFDTPVGREPVAMSPTGSDEGTLVLVTGTATGSSVTLHTSAADPGLNQWDEVTVYAGNVSSSSKVTLSLEWGGTTSPGDVIATELLPLGGMRKIMYRRRISGSRSVKAFASVANVVVCHVQVDRVREFAG